MPAPVHALSPARPVVVHRLAFVVVLAIPLMRPQAQVVDVRGVTPPAAAPLASTLRGAQAEFESFRRNHLPVMSLGRPASGSCDEHVGRFCYWYDENESPPPPEPESIRDARNRLLVRLDSTARAYPSDRWTAGQLVRYLVEAGRDSDAVQAAQRCTATGWWCDGVRGFALHAAGRYAKAESAYTSALAQMNDRERCEWQDIKFLLDDDLLKEYRDLNCKRRQAFEQRVWWLSRPMMSASGNDALTEYHSRMMMTYFLEDAPSTHALGFDADERELLLRYSWPTAWTRASTFPGMGGDRPLITGHEPAPSPPMLPMASTVQNPAMSDSLGWRGKGLPGVRARYAPSYARRLVPLMHQAALFRRGDSALVVMAYDVSRDTALAAAAAAPNELSAALVLTRGDPGDARVVQLTAPGTSGTITARSAWAPTLMSAEVAAPSRQVLARARYGLRATDLAGSRVSVSDLLLFRPYDGLPDSLEAVLPHVLPNATLTEGGKVGIYWETYNTSPTGEGIQVGITVAPEGGSGGWLRRGLVALRLVREAQPVTVGMRDVSARGRGYTPRAVVVDLSTLKPGRYLMQLEITAEGTIPVRAERVVVVK